MLALAKFIDQVSLSLNKIALRGAVLAVLVMVFAAAWQVVARYILDAPPVWTEELARRAMVWAGMLGASAAFRLRTDPTLFPAMVDIRGRMGHLLAIIRAAGVGLFVIPVIWYSIFGSNMSINMGFMARSLGRQAEMLPVQMIWFTSAVPIALTLILIHVIAGLFMQFTGQEQAEKNSRKIH